MSDVTQMEAMLALQEEGKTLPPPGADRSFDRVYGCDRPTPSDLQPARAPRETAEQITIRVLKETLSGLLDDLRRGLRARVGGHGAIHTEDAQGLNPALSHHRKRSARPPGDAEMSDESRFFRKFYPHQAWSEMSQGQRADLFQDARTMRPWRRFALLAFAGMLAALIGVGVTQRDVRAAHHRAVLACDAGWMACRASWGKPVKDAHGCLWRGISGPDDQLEFLKLGANGKYAPCPWSPEPDEEAAEDPSSCGVGWDVCLREALR